MRTVDERIESFGEEHVSECASLLVATFNAEPWNDDWTIDSAKKELAWTMGVPGFVGFVALGDGVVAFATGYRQPHDVREVFYLKTFCVRPDVQGTGVGSNLLGHLKKHLGEGGVRTIYLITHKGTPAEAFYEKNGYAVSSVDIVMTQEW